MVLETRTRNDYENTALWADCYIFVCAMHNAHGLGYVVFRNEDYRNRNKNEGRN